MTRSTLVDGDRMAAAVDLLARLVGALELRETSDPDSPPWAAEREIRRLEHEIMVCLHNEPWIEVGGAESSTPAGGSARAFPGIECRGMAAG